MDNNEYNRADAMACVRGASDGAKDAAAGKTRAIPGRGSAYIDGYNAGYLFQSILRTPVE